MLTIDFFTYVVLLAIFVASLFFFRKHAKERVFLRSRMKGLEATNEQLQNSIEKPRRDEACMSSMYPVGTYCFIRSNEPEPLIIGQVVGYWTHERSGECFLVFESDPGGESFTNFNQNPHLYSLRKHELLLEMTWWEQWNMLSQSNHIPIHVALKKERETGYQVTAPENQDPRARGLTTDENSPCCDIPLPIM